jgi:DNA topoisomerase-1
MTRKGGWRRRGNKRRGFRYYDAREKEITDLAKVARIEQLRIPPAWTDVWISPSSTAKLQATGVDAAGRRQYLYHSDFRAAQEQAKYDKLIRFAEKLPDLRAAMSEHMDRDALDRERVAAIALRLINIGWFRVGSERYARQSQTYGITTLGKTHVTVRGNRIALAFRGKHKIWVRTTLADAELADALKELIKLPGGRRLFRYRNGDGELVTLTSRRLNEYIAEHMGAEFTAKDFRTWGGTLLAAIAFAERGPAESPTQAKKAVAAVMRTVAERLGNTPAVTRASYVSPAVVDQYLDGRTIEDFWPDARAKAAHPLNGIDKRRLRPRHLRVVGARDIGLDLEEQATLSLLRSWRIRRAREAA